MAGADLGAAPRRGRPDASHRGGHAPRRPQPEACVHSGTLGADARTHPRKNGRRNPHRPDPAATSVQNGHRRNLPIGVAAFYSHDNQDGLAGRPQHTIRLVPSPSGVGQSDRLALAHGCHASLTRQMTVPTLSAKSEECPRNLSTTLTGHRKVSLSSSDRTPPIRIRGEPARRLLSNGTKFTLYPLSVGQFHQPC